MKQIHKYQFEIARHVIIPMPFGSKVLTVQVQNNIPCIWAIVDTDAELCLKSFCCFGTGHGLPDDITAMPYVGTIQMAEGALVFHLFEGTP